jgi:F-type H+-transporting ATPase subunit a
MHALEKDFLYILAFIPVSPGAILPWLVTLFCLPACLYLTRKLDQDIPEKHQNLLEFIYESLESFVVNVTGPENVRELLPVLSTIFIYIFFANLMGLIPGLKAPMSLFANAMGMALIVFFLMFWLGFKHHGIGYFKHFIGPVW